MKKYLIILYFFGQTSGTAAQPDCILLNTLVDSIHILNSQRLTLGTDTPAVKKFFRENYAPLRLSGAAVNINWEYIHFDIDMALYDTVHQCIIKWAERNNFFVEWHQADETGFRRLSVYDTRKKKNSILYYRNYHNSLATRESKKDKFYLAVSLNW